MNMDEFDEVPAGLEIHNKESVKVGEVKTGGVVIGEMVEVEEIHSGGIVICGTVEGLEEVRTGGVLVCQDMDSVPESSIAESGLVFQELDEYLSYLQSGEVSKLDDGSGEDLQGRIEKVERLQRQVQF